ncbi:MAG: GIY-YIG nuclease family protein, partial [Stellaceae bacterium]
MHIFVYMLRCSDGSYYVGSTRAGLEQRLSQHDLGHFGGYTAKRRPVTLVFQQDFQRITDAAERQLKGWSRAKKEALIRGDFPKSKRSRTAGPSGRRCGVPFDTVIITELRAM